MSLISVRHLIVRLLKDATLSADQSNHSDLRIERAQLLSHSYIRKLNPLTGQPEVQMMTTVHQHATSSTSLPPNRKQFASTLLVRISTTRWRRRAIPCCKASTKKIHR